MKVEKVCNCETSFQEKDQNGRFKAILLATLTRPLKTEKNAEMSDKCKPSDKIIDVLA